jgi:hypothetical protein
MRKQLNLLNTAVITRTKALLASFEVSYFIAENKTSCYWRDIAATGSLQHVRNYGENYCQALKKSISHNTVMR